jgi:hypothetical protein
LCARVQSFGQNGAMTLAGLQSAIVFLYGDMDNTHSLMEACINLAEGEPVITAAILEVYLSREDLEYLRGQAYWQPQPPVGLLWSSLVKSQAQIQ